MKPILKLEFQGAIVKVFHEEDPDWSWVEDPRDKEQLESGALEQFVIEVAVSDKSGEVLGSDILGGVVMGTAQDLETQAKEVVTEHKMIDSAHEDLERKLKAIFSANQLREVNHE